MTVTISRLYDNYTDAQRAVTSLEAAGVPHADLSIVANNSDNWYGADKKVDRDRDGTDDRAEGAATGAGIGAGLGGAAGLLAGLGVLAIPGLGPVVCSRMASVHDARGNGRRRNRHHRGRLNEGWRVRGGGASLRRRCSPRRDAGLGTRTRGGPRAV